MDSRKLIRIVEKLNEFGIKTKFTYTYNHHPLKRKTESLKAIEGRKGLEDFLEAYERGDAQPLYFDVYKDSETPFTIVVTEYEYFLKMFVVGESSVTYQDTPWDKIVILHKGHPMVIPDPMDEEKIDYIRKALSVLPEEARVSRVANGTVFDADGSRIVRIPPGIPDDEEAFLATCDVSHKTLVFTKKREKDSFGLYLLEDTRLHKIEEIGFSELPRIAVFPNGAIIKLPKNTTDFPMEADERYDAFDVLGEGTVKENEELSMEMESLFRRYEKDGKNWAFTRLKTLDFGVDEVKLYSAGITNGSGGVLRYAVSIDDGSLIPKTGLYLPDHRDEADFLVNAMGDGLYYMLYHRRPSEGLTVGYSGMRLFGKDRPLREVIVKNGNEEVECFFHGKNETAIFVSVPVDDVPEREEKRGEDSMEIKTSDFLVPYSYIKEIAEKKEGSVVLELDSLRERFGLGVKTVSRRRGRGERYKPLYEDSEKGTALFQKDPYYDGPLYFYDGEKVHGIPHDGRLYTHSRIEVTGNARNTVPIRKATSHLVLTLPPGEDGKERMAVFGYRDSFPYYSMVLVATFDKSKLGLDENEKISHLVFLKNGEKGILALFSTVSDKKGYNVRTYELDMKGENEEASVVEIGRDSTSYLDPFFQIDAESRKIYLSVSDRDGRRRIPVETDASFLFGAPDETSDAQPNP